MAWSDEPTDAQLSAIYHLIRWKIPDAKAILALDWLRERATRREVSYEMKRLRELYISHKLTKDNCFDSEIWEGFEYDGS